MKLHQPPDVDPPARTAAAVGELAARLLVGIARRVEQVLADLGQLASATAAVAASARLADRPLRRPSPNPVG
jgi:hypothetical protein